MPKRYAVGFLLTTLTFMMCQKDPTTSYDCTSITPTYSSDIKAIMDSKCATSGCHSSGSRAAGINLSAYASVKAESANGRFLGTIEHQAGYRAMPQGSSKLADASIQKIYCWIQSGQPE